MVYASGWCRCFRLGALVLAFGHYLAEFDGGAFADVVVSGDIHQQNADRVGCTRKEVKTLTYAFIYGASDKKIGTSLDKSLSEEAAKKLGASIRKKFLESDSGP